MHLLHFKLLYDKHNSPGSQRIQHSDKLCRVHTYFSRISHVQGVTKRPYLSQAGEDKSTESVAKHLRAANNITRMSCNRLHVWHSGTLQTVA